MRFWMLVSKEIRSDAGVLSTIIVLMAWVAVRNMQQFWNPQCLECSCGSAFTLKTTLTCNVMLLFLLLLSLLSARWMCRSLWIVYVMSFEGGRPPLFTSTLSVPKISTQQAAIMKGNVPPHLTSGITALWSNSTLATYGMIYFRI